MFFINMITIIRNCAVSFKSDLLLIPQFYNGPTFTDQSERNWLLGTLPDNYKFEVGVSLVAKETRLDWHRAENRRVKSSLAATSPQPSLSQPALLKDKYTPTYVTGGRTSCFPCSSL